MFNPKNGSFDQFLKNSWMIQWLIVYEPGIKELSGPDTRPVRIGINFSRFLGPGPVRDFQILLPPGSILPWNCRKTPVLIRVDSKFPKNFRCWFSPKSPFFGPGLRVQSDLDQMIGASVLTIAIAIIT